MPALIATNDWYSPWKPFAHAGYLRMFLVVHDKEFVKDNSMSVVRFLLTGSPTVSIESKELAFDQ